MKAQQLSLFDDSTAQFAGLMPALKTALHRAANECKTLSREQIVDRMNKQAKSAGISLNKSARVLSLATLEKWLNPSNSEHKPSVEAVVLFCLVVKDTRPMNVLLRALGCEVMTPDDRKLRDYARADIDEQQARKKKKRLKEELT